MLQAPRGPWASVLIYSWMLGQFAGVYFFGGAFGLVVCAGWLIAMVLWGVKEWMARRSREHTNRPDWGQAAIYTLFLHWVAVVLLVGDLAKATRSSSGSRSGDTDGSS